jgi:hypothetical protein
MSDEDKYWHIAPAEEHPVSRHNWSKPSATADDARADLAEIAFQNPDWSLGNILSWIAFRERERIVSFATDATFSHTVATPVWGRLP